MGGAIGEIDNANERVREIAKQGDDAGTEAFFSSWVSMADRTAELANEAEAAGHYLSAAEKYARATAYYVTAERMQSRHYAPRKQAYRAMLQPWSARLSPVRSIASASKYLTKARAFLLFLSRNTALARGHAWCFARSR